MNVGELKRELDKFPDSTEVRGKIFSESISREVEDVTERVLVPFEKDRSAYKAVTILLE